MTTDISNNDNAIDSRDVISRIKELESEKEDCKENQEEFENQEELDSLIALQDQCERYVVDWKYGEILIRDTYFQDYAKELAEECDMIKDDSKWPLNCIDWEKAADELQQDYISVEFDGETYWIR
jgi:hypothetical protein